MNDKSFYIFLNNNISKSRYLQNTCNNFKTDIHPVIELDSSLNWEVAITSAIIPYIAYKEEDITGDSIYEKCIINWQFFYITNNQDGTTTRKSKEFQVIFRLHEFLHKTGEEIIQLIITRSAAEGIIKKKSLEPFFLSYLNRFVLKSYIYPNFMSHDDHYFWNFEHVSFAVNECFQNFLGLNNSRYTLFRVNHSISKYNLNVIVGEYKIGDTQSPPKYIKVYSDLINGNRYGDQIISLMDVLPFNNDTNCERKMTTPVYSTLRCNIIQNISILIFNEKNKRFLNHTQDIVFTFHFRKKENIL